MVNKCRQEAFGFGHGQRAGRQRDAGHAVFALAGNAVANQPVFAGKGFDFGLVAGGNAGHNQVLIGGQAEVALVDFGDFAHTCFQRAVRRIGDAAVFDKQRQMPFFVFALHPADAVAARGEFIRAYRPELRPHAVFHFFDKHIQADALDGVAGFGVFAVAAVAPVALYGNHGGGAVQHFVQTDKAEFAGGVGVGFVIAVFDGQAAADQHVESGQPAVFFDGNEVQIVGMQIDVVVRRNNDRGFEFARQVVPAQNGFGRVAAFHGFGQRGVAGVFGGFDFFAVQPDFGIGAGFRQQVLADFLRPFVRFLVQPAFNRVAGA